MQKIKNNWYVLTGSPCSGKTAILNELAKSGFKVVYEAARIYIDKELGKGKTLKEIRKDEMTFQRKVLQMKIDLEKKLSPKELVFLERGIPDSNAYFKLYGVNDDKKLSKALKSSSYKKTFLLRGLKYKKDYARAENKTTARRLEALLEESYDFLKIPVVKVPVMSVGKRVQYILKMI